jgi:hypothetical protein
VCWQWFVFRHRQYADWKIGEVFCSSGIGPIMVLCWWLLKGMKTISKTQSGYSVLQLRFKQPHSRMEVAFAVWPTCCAVFGFRVFSLCSNLNNFKRFACKYVNFKNIFSFSLWLLWCTVNYYINNLFIFCTNYYNFILYAGTSHHNCILSIS